MLVGSHVVLRPPKDQDLSALGDLRNDLQLQQLLMARPRPNSEQRVRDWLNTRCGETSSIFFVVSEKATDQAIGFVQLINLDLLDGIGELGICISPSWRGQQRGAEALQLLEQYAIGVFNLRKIILQVLAGNQPATAFFEKFGFRKAGTYHKHHYHDGIFHDVVIMEKILRS